MLTVIKKDLREVDFMPEKIKVSVGNSGNDVNFMLNQVDLNLIAQDVEKKIISIRGIDGKTSSYEINSLVIEALHNLGFKKVANSFYNGSFQSTKK